MKIEKFEYWDAELPNQSKKIMASLERGLTMFGGEITDRHEDKYFSGKQQWRNPLLLRIKLPAGKRWTFILETKIKLLRPEVISVPDPFGMTSRGHKLKADHSALRKVHRRNYRFHPFHSTRVTTYHLDGTESTLLGGENLCAVLNGNLDLVL